MVLPTSREMELETLIRQRDKQIAELSDEVVQLRQYLVTQPGPSTVDPITLPPAVASILLPQIHSGAASRTSGSSSTVTAALTQRTRLLQDENDELYELLKSSETGKLKEEVKVLRRVVSRLENALQESHQVINSLSTELNKSYDAFMNASRQGNAINYANHHHSQSPRANYHQSNAANGSSNSSSRPPPTGPRAYKKPRMSDTQSPPRPASNLPSLHKNHHRSPRPNSNRPGEAKDYNARHTNRRGRGINHTRMDVTDEQPPSDDYRERLPRERDRERERERESSNNKPRRNGHFTGRGGGSGAGNNGGRRTERSTASNHHPSGPDRTLAERLGPLNHSS